MFNRLKWAIAIAGALSLGASLAAPAVAGEAELYEAAKKEGEIVWYTALLQNQLVRPMAAAFEAKYPGIKVKIAGGIGTDLTLKVLEEARAGTFNVDVHNPAGTAELDKAGLLAAYYPEAAKNFPQELKSVDGKWVSVIQYFFGLSVNTEMVKEADIPKTMDDLLDPKWKGKIASVAALTAGGLPAIVYGMQQRLGDEKARVYLSKLADQKIIRVPSNQRVVLDQVIAGQYPMALMTFQHHAHISAAKGAPVKFVPLDPVISTSETVVLMKHAPHPNAAKLFVEYMLSEDGAKFISDADYVPANPSVKSRVPTVSESLSHQKPLVILPEFRDANLATWVKTYQDIFK